MVAGVAAPHLVTMVLHRLDVVAGVHLTLTIVAMCVGSVVTIHMIVLDLDVVVEEVLGVGAGHTLVPDLVLVIIVVVHTAEAPVHEEVVIVHQREDHEAMIKRSLLIEFSVHLRTLMNRRYEAIAMNYS
jgi:hypothetical protein